MTTQQEKVAASRDSAIIHHEGGGTTLTGDATRLLHFVSVQQGIRLYIETNGRLIMTRGATIGYLLERATAIVQPKVPYKKSRAHYERALKDLTEYISLVKSSIPHVDGKTGETL